MTARRMGCSFWVLLAWPELRHQMLDIELRVDQLIERERASRRQYRLRLAVIGEAGCHFAQCTAPQTRQIDPISHRRAGGIDESVVKFHAPAAPVPEYRRIERQGVL